MGCGYLGGLGPEYPCFESFCFCLLVRFCARMDAYLEARLQMGQLVILGVCIQRH